MISPWQLHPWILLRAICQDSENSRWVSSWTTVFIDPGGCPVSLVGLVWWVIWWVKVHIRTYNNWRIKINNVTTPASRSLTSGIIKHVKPTLQLESKLRNRRIWRLPLTDQTTDGHFVGIVLRRRPHFRTSTRCRRTRSTPMSPRLLRRLSASIDHQRGRVYISRLTWEKNRRWIRDDWLCVGTITNHIQSTLRRASLHWWRLFRLPNSPRRRALRGFSRQFWCSDLALIDGIETDWWHWVTLILVVLTLSSLPGPIAATGYAVPKRTLLCEPIIVHNYCAYWSLWTSVRFVKKAVGGVATGEHRRCEDRGAAGAE